jgi:hypothetical protein
MPSGYSGNVAKTLEALLDFLLRISLVEVLDLLLEGMSDEFFD